MRKLNDDSSTSNNEDGESSERINRVNSDCCDNNFEASEKYKNAVAKRLAEILERRIEGQDENLEKKKSKRLKKKKKVEEEEEEDDSLGIRLMSRSTTILTKVNDESLLDSKNNDKLNCKNRKKHVNQVELRSKCREVAVDPDWILSKCETKYWHERQRGCLYKYKKMPNGLLVEQQ